MPKQAILIILILILSTGNLHAETIKQRSYIFRYDNGADGMADQTYLICNDCQDDKPTIIPNLVAHASVAIYSKNDKNPGKSPTMPQAQQDSLTRQDEREKPITEIVHFNFDSAMLLPEAISMLDHIQTGKSLHLKGYTCTIGSGIYNLGLSQKRADAVSLYLKKRGISILSSIGFGKSSMYSEKSLNRRVELIENKEKNGP
jgi:outer membrane protein OmpA-like peptidoglycan-associated protein